MDQLRDAALFDRRNSWPCVRFWLTPNHGRGSSLGGGNHLRGNALLCTPHDVTYPYDLRGNIKSAWSTAEAGRSQTTSASGRKKNKGCDFGYALAAHSCEGANSMDACTVTAFGAITAFAVPNPNESSQRPSVFSGSGVRRIASPDEPPSLLRTGNVLFSPSLLTVDGAILIKEDRMSTPKFGAESQRFPPLPSNV